jgi:hypothetical protein
VGRGPGCRKDLRFEQHLVVQNVFVVRVEQHMAVAFDEAGSSVKLAGWAPAGRLAARPAPHVVALDTANQGRRHRKAAAGEGAAAGPPDAWPQWVAGPRHGAGKQNRRVNRNNCLGTQQVKRVRQRLKLQRLLPQIVRNRPPVHPKQTAVGSWKPEISVLHWQAGSNRRRWPETFQVG